MSEPVSYDPRTVESAAPEPAPAQPIGTTIAEILSSTWAKLGGLAIFLYVGAEVAIGTQLAVKTGPATLIRRLTALLVGFVAIRLLFGF